MHEFAVDPPMEERVGDLLERRGETVAVAEGCTGGLVGALLTSRPGASAYLDRVVVPYDYDALRDLLAVSRETLDAHGAVSEPAARETAQAARDTADATWGVGATGVLGPGGGTPETPVGTAFVAVAYAGEWESGTTETRVERHALDGDRRELKSEVARTTLRMLHEAIIAQG